jgi:hypothetical protein
VREAIARLPADCALASTSVRLAPLLAWESGRALVLIVGGGGEVTYGLDHAEGEKRRVDDADFPAWLAAERRERPVVLFTLDHDARHPGPFPAADRTEQHGLIVVLHYDRRDG